MLRLDRQRVQAQLTRSTRSFGRALQRQRVSNSGTDIHISWAPAVLRIVQHWDRYSRKRPGFFGKV